MPLFEHGFLGTEADQIRQQILQKYTELFASLNQLNDICHEYLRTAKYHHGEGIDVSAVSYFMRGLMTFQSLIVLLERGCIEDVRALCRTLLQACFRLAAIAIDPTVVNRIVASALDLDRQRLRHFKSGVLKMPPGASDVDLDAKIAEPDAKIRTLGGSMVTDKELATIGGRLGDYYTAYALQSDAAHGRTELGARFAVAIMVRRRPSTVFPALLHFNSTYMVVPAPGWRKSWARLL
jgi:hypothetical protein